VNISNSAEVTYEIALNPKYFQEKMLTGAMATFAHELTHLWQANFGKCGRGRYHNREWTQKMYSICLIASDTGKPSGKPTGDRVSHYIREDGPFDRACARYLASHSTALFQDCDHADPGDETEGQQERERKAASKTKYAVQGTSKQLGLSRSHSFFAPSVRNLCSGDTSVRTEHKFVRQVDESGLARE